MNTLLTTLSTLLGFALLILFFWWVYYRFRLHKGHKFKYPWGRITIYVFILFAIFMTMSDMTNPNSASNTPNGQFSSTSKKSSINITSSEKKAKSESMEELTSSEATSKKEQREKNQKERDNFERYKKALSDLPNKTNKGIKVAYYSKSEDLTIMVINNKIQAGTDAQLKSSVHGAWKIGQDYLKKYSPLPSSVTSTLVTVRDENETQLAHTSVLGSFKYDANK